MVKLYNIFQVALFASLLSFAPLSNAEPKQSVPELPVQPVWEGMKPADSHSPDKSLPPGNSPPPAKADTGFAKPPPATSNQHQKLTAKILSNTRTDVVLQGERVTFIIESNEPNLRYYWISDGVKSTKNNFTVDTANLELGKHRVRATVTNKKRKQAHASIFFTVIEGSADTANSQNDPSLGDDASRSPELDAEDNTVTTDPNASAQTDNNATGEVAELPAVNTDGTQSVKLVIMPTQVTTSPNEEVTFKTNIKAVDGYSFHWKFAAQRGKNESFKVSSGNLKPGQYQVHLTVVGKDKVAIKSQATVQVRSNTPDSLFAPDLVGHAFSAIKQQLASQNLMLGKVSKRPVKTGQGTVIEQSPLAGNQIPQGSVINVVMGVSSVVSVPDLLGLKKEEVKQQFLPLGLTIGEVTSRINNRAIGLVIEQSPKAGTSLERGSTIDLVFGKPTPKPLTVTIQPVSTVTELGQPIELSAVIVDPEVDNNLSFSWTLGDLSGADRIFKIDSSQLTVGEHTVNLSIKDADNRQVSATSVIKITAKTIQLPDVTGKSMDLAHSALEAAGLTVGDVQQKPSDVTEETVLEQTPSAGERIILGGKVQLLVAVPKPEEESVITLEADNNEVKMGDPITFSLHLTPPPKSDDIHYVYTINEKKLANVQPSLQWTPDQEGIYTIVVAAFSDKGILAKSSSLTITVLPGWEMPVAKIIPEMPVVNQGNNAEFVSTSTYDLNSSLKYEWSSESEHGGSSKQFAFDTSELEPGSYTINLTVIDDQDNQSSASTMLVIQASIDNINTQKGLKDQALSTPVIKPKITLTASRRFINTDTAVKIKAVSDVSLTAANYYFETGDEINTDWLDVNETEHIYKGFGAYRVRAAVKQLDKVYYSDSITLWVFSPLLLLFLGGGTLLASLLLWRWTRYVPSSSKEIADVPVKKSVVMETVVPLKKYENDIITEARPAKPMDGKKDPTVVSVLLKGLLQFLLGIAISVLILYLVLKSMNLI